MYNLAANKCNWIMTKKPGQFTCGKPCVGDYCSPHNMVIKAGRTLAKPCTQCNKNGTRSITGLCLACGGQKAIKRISAKNNYHRKKSQQKILTQ